MKHLFFLILLAPFCLCAQTPVLGDSLGSAEAAAEQANPALQKISALRGQVLSGEKSMNELARQYSEDPGSAKNGGLLLNVRRGVMVPEFETVAFGLKAGEVSEIFETQYGYHFIQLLEHNGETLNLRHILIMPK